MSPSGRSGVLKLPSLGPWPWRMEIKLFLDLGYTDLTSYASLQLYPIARKTFQSKNTNKFRKANSEKGPRSRLEDDRDFTRLERLSIIAVGMHLVPKVLKFLKVP